MYDSSEELLVTHFALRQAPEGCTGYTSVVGVLIFYAILVGGLMLAFVCWTRNSILGNAWSTVGRIVSQQETDSFVRLTGGMTDKEVREYLKGHGRN